MDRRLFLAGAAGTALATGVRAQTASLPAATPASEPCARLRDGQPHHLTPDQEAQRVTESPAPSGPPGRWVTRAALPRSEMAWATAAQGRMHIVGGCGEGAVNRAYHHIYDPASERWLVGAPLPRGANHVAVAISMFGACNACVGGSAATATPT